MKKTLFPLLTSFVLTAYMPVENWKGTLLLNQSGNELTALVDNAKDLSGITVEIYDGLKVSSYHLVKSGRKVTVSLGNQQGGWVRVLKDGVAVSSVRLENYQEASLAYINYRYQDWQGEAYSIKEALVKQDKAEIVEKPEAKFVAKTPSSQSEVQEKVTKIVSPTGEEEFTPEFPKEADTDFEPAYDTNKEKGGDLVVESPEVKVVEANATTKTHTTVLSPKEKDERVVMHDELEKLMKYHSPTLDEHAKKVNIDYLIEKYKVVKLFDGWVELEDKNKKKTYAFNGTELFKFTPDKFDVTISESDITQSFISKNEVKFIPVSEKWIGIFMRQKYMGSLKWKKKFMIEAITPNELRVKSDDGAIGIDTKQRIKNY